MDLKRKKPNIFLAYIQTQPKLPMLDMINLIYRWLGLWC